MGFHFSPQGGSADAQAADGLALVPVSPYGTPGRIVKNGNDGSWRPSGHQGQADREARTGKTSLDQLNVTVMGRHNPLNQVTVLLYIFKQ